MLSQQLDALIKASEQRTMIMREIVSIILDGAAHDDAFIGRIAGIGRYAHDSMVPPMVPPMMPCSETRKAERETIDQQRHGVPMWVMLRNAEEMNRHHSPDQPLPQMRRAGG